MVFVLGHIELIAIADLVRVVHGDKWGDVQTISLYLWGKLLNHCGLLSKNVVVVGEEANHLRIHGRWIGCIVILIVLVMLVNLWRKGSVQENAKVVNVLCMWAFVYEDSRPVEAEDECIFVVPLLFRLFPILIWVSAPTVVIREVLVLMILSMRSMLLVFTPFALMLSMIFCSMVLMMWN